jgi:RNA polymerase sigma-70 factor (ECF subfamily)
MDELAADSSVTRTLLRAARDGKAGACEQLFARHRAELLAFVELRLDSRMRARIDADDIVQETQMEVFRRLDDFLVEQPMPFRVWLRRKAFERLTDFRRRHVFAARRSVRREAALPDRSSRLLAQRLVASGATPSQQLAQRELANQVRQALAQMSEAHRDILFMRNYEGLSYEEAACILGIEPATARKRHGRALLRLHELLSADNRPEDDS